MGISLALIKTVMIEVLLKYETSLSLVWYKQLYRLFLSYSFFSFIEKKLYFFDRLKMELFWLVIFFL